MRSRRALLSVLLSSAVVIAGCASGSTDSPGAAPTVDEPPSTAPLTTPATEPATEVPDTSAPEPDSPAPGVEAFDQLEEIAEASGHESVEFALAEFSTFFGPIPDTPQIEWDPSVYPSFTGSIGILANQADALSEAQRSAVDEVLVELANPDRLIGSFDLSTDDITAPATTEPEGFRRSAAAPAGAADPVVQYWIDEANAAWVQLFAQLPRPARPATVKVLLNRPGLWDAGSAGASTVFNDRRYSNPLLDRLLELYDGEAQKDCYIIIETADVRGNEARGISAHELFHCWHFAHLGYDSDRVYDSPIWIVEGLAAWVGEKIGGGSPYGANWWPRYFSGRSDASWRLFRSTYPAIGFWSDFDEAAGLWASIPRVVENGDQDSNSILGVLFEIAGAQRSFLGSGPTQRSELGPEWTVAGPGMTGGAREVPIRTAEVGSFVDVVLEPGVQRAREVDFASSDDLLVATVEFRGATTIQWSDGMTASSAGDADESKRCLGEECVCPDGTLITDTEPILDAAPSVFVAGIGGPFDNGRITVRLATIEDECEEEPTTLGDDILIGTWRADNDAVARAFTEAFAFDLDDPSEALGVNGVSGNVVLTFGDNGVGSLQYDNVAISTATEGPFNVINLVGKGEFLWGAADGLVVISNSSFTISGSIDGIGEIPLTVTEGDIEEGADGETTLAYAVTGDQLSLTDPTGTRGAVFFADSWIREP